jgi:hypothetical protein
MYLFCTVLLSLCYSIPYRSASHWGTVVLLHCCICSFSAFFMVITLHTLIIVTLITPRPFTTRFKAGDSKIFMENYQILSYRSPHFSVYCVRKETSRSGSLLRCTVPSYIMLGSYRLRLLGLIIKNWYGKYFSGSSCHKIYQPTIHNFQFANTSMPKLCTKPRQNIAYALLQI